MAQKQTKELNNRIVSFLRSNTPIKANGRTLSILNIKVKEPAALNDLDKQLEMKCNGSGDLKGWVVGNISIKDDKTGKVISQSGQMHIVPVYYATDRGTYIIGGKEKNILIQSRRKPGVYTTFKTDSVNTDFYVDNNAGGGYFPAMSMSFTPKSSKFQITVKSGGKSYNFDGVNFLRELGIDDGAIRRAMGDVGITDSVMAHSKGNKTIYNIHEALLGRKSNENTDITRLNVVEFLKNNGKFGSGRNVVKDNIGSNALSMGRDALLKSVSKMFKVLRKEQPEDDINDLRHREFLTNNDVIMEQIAKDFKNFQSSAIDLLNNKETPNYVGLKSGLSDLGKSLDKFMRESELVLNGNQLNPVAVQSYAAQSTMGSSVGSGNKIIKPRDIKGVLSANRLDPIDTPESLNAGLTERISDGAILKNKTIYIPVLKVRAKAATVSDSNTYELSPDDEYKVKVAFHDPRYLEKSGNKIIIKGINGKIPGRYQGKSVDLRVSEVQYIDKRAQGLFNTTANMIPFATQDDGVRTEMGTKYQQQAVVLKNRELPLVSAKDGDGITFEKKMGDKYGKAVYSTVAGEVSEISGSKIVIKDARGKKHTHQYYNYFPVNQGYINNELKVKVGDKVKKGQMLAEGWQTRDGQLALGVNAKIAYMPYKGYNYEDGIVISESFAKKMTAEEVYTQEIYIKSDAIGGRNSNVQAQLKAYSTNAEIFSKLDKDGIIKVGERVKAGNILAASLVPKKTSTSRASVLTGNSLKYSVSIESIDRNSYIDGIVKRVAVVNSPDSGSKQKIIVYIVQEKPLKKGDKVSGKHGNKGTVTAIIADAEMPVAQDGERLDLIFSTAAIPSRKNIGQLFETSAGELAHKTGKRMLVDNFDPKDREKVIKGLKTIGNASGKQKVKLKEFDSNGKLVNITTENPVTVGNMYIMKLNHKVDDKIQARSNIEGFLNRKTGMPQKEIGGKPGERHNPLRLGEQEMSALQAHQAVWNVLEATTFKSDGGGDAAQRMALFDAISTGKLDGLNYPTTPQTLNVLKDTLTASGLNVKPINSETGKKTTFDSVYDSIALAPMKPSNLIKTIGAKNEVTLPYMWNARDKTKKETDEPVAHGLIDPKIFGDLNDPDSRNKWGYIRLATPMPNPVLSKERYNPYRALTGMKSTDFNNLMNGKAVMIVDPSEYKGSAFNGMKAKDKKMKIAEIKASMAKAGVKSGDLISPDKLEMLIRQFGEILWKAGGEGLQHQLDKIDVNKELKATKKALNSAKSSEVDGLYKKYRTLNMLKENKMEASDLMMQYVPVAPTYLRNPIQQGKVIINPDVNKLYSQLITTNTPLKENLNNGFDMYTSSNPVEAARATANLYKKTAGLTGTITAQDFKTKKELKGLMQPLAGKKGLIHHQMLGKRVDFSGRSVIGVEPSLSMDEAILPYDMARDLYRPFIVRELLKSGKAKNQEDAMKKLDNKHKDAVEAAQRVADDRPVILNRAPSLHKYSLQAYHPLIKDGVKNIQVNPLTVTGFNADFDGDTNVVHVPVTEKAKEEAKKLMMPSQNLINPSNGKPILKIRHEMALGIYYLTMDYDKPVGKGVKFSSTKALYTAYKDGKVHSRTKVSVGMLRNMTAGQVLYNSMIPKGFRNYRKVWSESDVNAMLFDMYKLCEATGGKEVSMSQITKAYNDLKDLGFLASTRSGISLGIQDFAEGAAAAEKVTKAVGALEKKTGKKLGDDAVEKAIEKSLKEGKLIKKSNPVSILLNSGARGNAGQFRRIMGTVGVGKAVTGELTKPIKHSHFAGLGPREYLMHGRDSRKGLFDRSVQTMDPGALTKSVVSAMQDVVIKEADCKTTAGIELPKSNADILGRYAAAPIKDKNGKIICKRNQIITHAIRDAIYKDSSITTVKVRSPLHCKTVGGVCQKCYGTAPGTMKLQHLGTPVGTLSAQAMGEPVTQMTMNTFHGGGTSSSPSAGLPKVKQLLGMNADKNNQAVLSTVSGKITAIKRGGTGTYDSVYVNGTLHRIPHILGGGPQMLRVAVGDYVTKGDFLTVGNLSDIRSGRVGITSADPNTLLKLKTDSIGQDDALKQTRDYLAGSLSKAFDDAAGAGKISNRHLETIMGKLTSKATVTNGGSSNLVRGSVASSAGIQRWNEQNAGISNAKRYSISKAQEIVGKIAAQPYKSKTGTIIVNKGEQITANHIAHLVAAGFKVIRAYAAPIQYTPELVGVQQAGSFGSENWLSNLGTRELNNQIARGAMYGQKDKLTDSRARMMTGKMLPIGEGFSKPRRFINALGTNIRNFFLRKK